MKSCYYILGSSSGSGSTSIENQPEMKERKGVIPFKGSDFYAGARAGEGLETQQEIRLGAQSLQ
jgi:hypothetical protein